MSEEDAIATDVAALRSDLKGLIKYIEGQFKHGQHHFERLEREGADRTTKIEALASRMATIEKSKVYAEGFKGGATWAVAGLISAVGAAAIWLMNKAGP